MFDVRSPVAPPSCDVNANVIVNVIVHANGFDSAVFAITFTMA